MIRFPGVKKNVPGKEGLMFCLIIHDYDHNYYISCQVIIKKNILP